MASASGRRKQLLAHLDAAFREIDRLSLHFRDAVAALEAATQSGLSAAGAADWFRMYLRLVDLGVEIRRGELRHRSSLPVSFPCMHATGARGARHSGLGIDDANAIYQQLERTPGVKESQLEVLFMRMDALDRDGVGPLDERLSACLARFVRLPSAFYARVEVSGSDPHQEMVIYDHQHRGAATKVTRACFGAASCLCLPDATPWVHFRLTPGDVHAAMPVPHGGDEINDDEVDAFAQSAISAVASHALDSEEIGLAELKRQYGFEQHQDNQADEDALAAAAYKRRRVGAPMATTSTAAAAMGRPPQPPRDIYRRKCQERGLARKRKIEELLVVKSGALELDLSHFGFHAPQELQDLLDVVVEAQVPVRLVDVTNNFFDARSFEIFCDLLRLPLLRANVRTLHLRCMALPQRPDFASLLRILTDADMGELEQLTTLDLSYNTFFEDAVLSLNDLLDGLKNLETLSLESCFPKAPDPGVVEVAVVKDLVRSALVGCCDRLRSLNFGSNWMSFPLLNSLFSVESALEELHIAQMTFFYFEQADAAPISWKFSFQRQQRITLSETRNSRCEYLPFFVDALTYCLKMRMAQLRHLDLWIVPPLERKTDDVVPEMHLDDRVTSLLQAFAEYGALRTARVRYDLSRDPQGYVKTRRVLAQLFHDGLKHCETLDLALQAPLSLADLRDLLARLDAPQLRSLKLSVRLLPAEPTAPSCEDGDEARAFGRVFRAAVASLTELTLDFKVELKQSKALLPDAVVQEMETAWRSLGSRHGDAKAASALRKVSLVKRKTKKDGTGPARSDLATFAFLFTSPSSSSSTSS